MPEEGELQGEVDLDGALFAELTTSDDPARDEFRDLEKELKEELALNGA